MTTMLGERRMRVDDKKLFLTTNGTLEEEFVKTDVFSKEHLGEYNRLKREIDKRRGQINSLNKCISHHTDRIMSATTPTAIGKEGKRLMSRVDSKRTIMQELSDLERRIRRIR